MNFLSNIYKAPLPGILIAFLLISGVSMAQNRIVLKDGSVINNAEVKEVKSNFVSFLQAGSLHDLETEKIKWLEKPTGEKLFFDEKGQAFSKTVKPDTITLKPEVAPSESQPLVIDSVALLEQKSAARKVAYYKELERRNALKEKTDTSMEEIQNRMSAIKGSQYEQGRADAKAHFRAPTATLLGFVAIPTGLIGVGGATMNILVNKPDRYIKNNVPALVKQVNDPEYYSGFKKGMQSKKLGNTVGGAALFAAIIFTGIAILFHGTHF